MQEIELSGMVNIPLIGFKEDGRLVYYMTIETVDDIKIKCINPALYPDCERIIKAFNCISFQYSDEAKRYIYLLNKQTTLRSKFSECLTDDERQFIVLSQDPNVLQSSLDSIEKQIKYLRNIGVKYKASKTKCLTDNERMLLSLNTQFNNMKNKIARSILEFPPVLQYEFMAPYSKLTIMSQDLFLEGNKLLNILKQSTRFDLQHNPMRYTLPPELQYVFQSILQFEYSIHLASIDEYNLILGFKEWQSHIYYTSNNLIPAIVPAREMTADNTVTITVANGNIPQCSIRI